MANIETKILSQSRVNKTKPTVWKRFVDNGTSLWDIDKQEIDLFLEQATSFHPTIKFTAEIADKEITFLDTVGYILKNDSKKTLFLTQKLTINRLKHFNTHITPPVTHQVSKEVLSKTKILDFYEQIPWEKISRNLSLISKHVFSRVDTLKKWREYYLKSPSPEDSRL